MCNEKKNQKVREKQSYKEKTLILVKKNYSNIFFFKWFINYPVFRVDGESMGKET
jgi:hypothetical protein